MAKQPIIPIQDFNMGGLADSRWSGVKSSFAKLTGWDIHSTPGLLKVAQKLTRHSPPEVGEFCKNKVVSTNGKIYWFSSTSGKIWQVDEDGTYTLVYTTDPLAGEAKCLGAAEYQGTIYWATEKYLHKINTTLALGAAAWTNNVSPSFGLFTNGDLDFHPMIEQNLVLFIGDGNLLAQVDAGTFSASALDIKDPLRIKSLGKVYTDVLIGTYVADYVTKTELVRWNTWSGSFQVTNSINEVGINAFIQGDNIILVQAGRQGRIYYYNPNLNTLESFKTIPGDYGPSKYGAVNPEAVANLNNIVLLGFSNGAGNPADQGVYQIGRHSRSYPYILDFPYPISERDTGDAFVVNDLEIGAIAVRGFDIYVSWQRVTDAGTTTGIDKIDYTQKLNGAFLETRVMMSPNRLELANYAAYYVAYARLPDDCDIELSLSKNYVGFEPVVDVRPDTIRQLIYNEDLGIEATSMQAKFRAVVSGNDAPEIESAALTLR